MQPTLIVGDAGGRSSLLSVAPKSSSAIAFTALVLLTSLTPFMMVGSLFYPAMTSKGFFLRVVIEIALPFYLLIILGNAAHRPSFKNPITLSLLAFLCVTLLSTAFGVNPFRSMWGDLERMGGTFHLAHLTLLYFYVLLLASLGRTYIDSLRWSIVVCGGLLAAFGILIDLTDNHFLIHDTTYPRVSATVGNPIFLASCLVIPLFFALYSAITSSRVILKVVCGLIAVADVWCVLLTRTRGAVIGILAGGLIGLLAYGLLTPKRQVRKWAIVILLCCAVLAGIAFSQHQKFDPNSMLGRVLNLQNSGTDVRLLVWKACLRGWRDYPLLGVGLENYYIIDTKYFDRTNYAYDTGWFDKPHNALLETLVTGGLLGIVAYLALLAAAVWGLFIAYCKRLVSLAAFCFLLAGLSAYVIQNCFAFETPAATVTLFVLLALAATYWRRARVESLVTVRPVSRQLRLAVVVVTVLAMACTLYGTNIIGLELASNISYGGRLGLASQPYLAETYFQAARQLPIDYDPVELAGKYSEFAVKLSATTQDVPFAAKVVDHAIASEKDALNKVPDHEVSWERLAGLYVTKARLLGQVSLLDPADAAIRKATFLAPNRPEPQMIQVRLKLYRNDRAGAQALLNQLLRDFPNDPEARMQAALLARDEGRMAWAAQLGHQALLSGFVPQQGREVAWLGDYYKNTGKFKLAAETYIYAVRAEPYNPEYRWRLAQVYHSMGDNLAAARTAQSVAALDAARQQEVSDFVKSLP